MPRELIRKLIFPKRRILLLDLLLVVLSLLVADGVILSILSRVENHRIISEYDSAAQAVKFTLQKLCDDALSTASAVFASRSVNAFLDGHYDSALRYYNQKILLGRALFLSDATATRSFGVTLYADNAGIINGGGVRRLESITNTRWYQTFSNSGKDYALCIYYNDAPFASNKPRRGVAFLRRLNYYARDTRKKLLRMELDVNQVSRSLMNLHFLYEIYVCADGVVLFTNTADQTDDPFETFDRANSVSYQTSLMAADKRLDIYVLEKPGDAGLFLRYFPMLAALLALNLLVPSVLIHMSYARKVREQELELTVQNAQLLALRSQLNAHFLFNTLESIRMHSLIKQEDETAHMVECLALLLRQYVDWGNDTITIEKELALADAYLKLQKYRFGDRLSYVIDMDEPSGGLFVPRLFIVTFVENVLIHGIEPKPGKGHVFVRTYLSEDKTHLVIEIDDSGVGMTETLAADILNSMRTGSIAGVKKKKRIGIVTACLRLRMLTNDKAKFELESEEHVGTFVRVTVPAEEINHA